LEAKTPVGVSPPWCDALLLIEDPHMPEHVVEFGKVGRPPEPDGRLDAPAFHRNHVAIWSVLGPFLRGRTGDILEVGSGTGQHAVAFAQSAADVRWWPSDVNEKHLTSIAAWRAHAQLANLQAPVRIDLANPDWALEQHELPRAFQAIVCINVLHITPWQVSQHLFAGAALRLDAEGKIFVYGPFKRDGKHTAASNAVFDSGLRSANAEWGVRDTTDIQSAAESCGLSLTVIDEMPANNCVLTFERI
jgi:SAM-dependent methyltransferase